MRRESIIHLMLFLFVLLFTLTMGFGLFSLDIPYEFESSTNHQTITLSNLRGSPAVENEINLGELHSWTTISIKYFTSGDAAGVKIAPSGNNYIQTDFSWAQQGSITYRLLVTKSVTIYLSYGKWGATISELGTPVSTTINLEIHINQSKIVPTNPFFTVLLPLLGYLGLSFFTRESHQKHQKFELSEKDQQRVKQLYKNNNTLCDICGKRLVVYIDKRTANHYCSWTCKYIDKNEGITLFAHYVTMVLTLILPPLILIDFLGIPFVIYGSEKDTPEYRFKNYDLARKLELDNKPSEADNGNEIEKLKEQDHEPMKFIEELNESFPVCCYQTARLGEVFCECGRTVPQKLIDFLTS